SDRRFSRSNVLGDDGVGVHASDQFLNKRVSIETLRLSVIDEFRELLRGEDIRPCFGFSQKQPIVAVLDEEFLYERREFVDGRHDFLLEVETLVHLSWILRVLAQQAPTEPVRPVVGGEILDDLSDHVEARLLEHACAGKASNIADESMDGGRGANLDSVDFEDGDVAKGRGSLQRDPLFERNTTILEGHLRQLQQLSEQFSSSSSVEVDQLDCGHIFSEKNPFSTGRE
ncbi:hypothetical protein PMAYCL1PPCAC_00966, partial [Pristionchus mayeri]